MPSERIQRQIDALLDEAEAAIRDEAWETVRQRIRSVQALDPENEDALNYAAAAGRADSTTPPPRSMTSGPEMTASTHPLPTSFVSGRYEVKRFLGEGGKKRVYLAHDTTLDRDVAFALIKTEGLDDASRQRITREAQAMGRLGDHPNIVTVYDIGEEDGQPYMVLPLLSGGDVEGVIERAEDHKLSIEEAIRIATETCEGLALAHGKGIVHRDLKPGNVWLTENGTAKIGDFGLAVAVDRSRLTQAGMMVGTVGYMPPEQAMGGEVTPQSDLYSLGCMLYEMVAGRPPFVGDESVAIIGQHLNTPPVSPTWHRPDCPPALEALILRLLEKDATKRPGSASEVKQALESVGQPSVGVPTPGSVIEESTHPHDPVYGRTFVGRENEVKQLQRAFDAALSGQGGLMMVVGEPGIGKTAITEQLATYAALRGGKALTGHCYEEGSLSLPYLAFVEAMRTYVIDRDPEGLRSDLGTGAADVARIVSEIRDRLDVQLPDSGEGDDDRYRLLQGVSDFLRNAASVTPLVIVLEDLHWADRGTLDLLLHVARNLQGARLLIVGTYRDVEVDRAHPLSAALAELRRISSFDRLLMRGLSVDDVRKMIQALAQQEEVRESFAQAVHRQTEGNPLFVQEVVRYVVEEGLVKREDGRYQPAGDTLPEMRIPEGLRDVIGKRLERLSLECNRVLASASVIGREFSLDALKAVVDMNEEDLTTALEEAVHLGILQDQSRAASIGFRFEHAFFRQTLYEEIFTPRRLRLHQEVARALENLYASRAKEHAAELAEHFAQSIDPSDLAKAVHYGETAAERAMTVFAFGEAARLLERALEAQAVLDPEDLAKRRDLLVAYAEPLMRVGEAQRADEIVLEEAFGLAETLQDHSRAVNACEQARWALRRYSAAPGAVGIVPRHSLWIERHRARAATPAELIQVELEQATVFGTTGRYGERWRTLSQALESARELQDLALALEAAGPLLSEFETPVKFQEMNRALAPEVLSWGYDGRNLRTALARARVGTIELMWGDRPRAQELWSELRDLREQSKDPRISDFLSFTEMMKATLDGDLEQALLMGNELSTKGDAIPAASSTLPARLYLGQPDEALAGMDKNRLAVDAPAAREGLRLQRPMFTLCLAHAGRLEEAQADMVQTLAALEEIGPLSDVPMNFLTQLLQVAVLTEDKEVAATLSRELRDASHLINGFCVTCVARHLGAASALLGRPDEARNYYAQALEVCKKVRFRPEIALIRLQLAELLLDQYSDERAEAIEHLDFAIGEFQGMKMQPSLERALRHRELLKA